MAAALVLAVVAAWQTAELARLRPPGAVITATVLAREMRAPAPGAVTQSTVILAVPGLGIVTTPHPPASLISLWPGATVAVYCHDGGIVYAPAIAERRHRATLIALACALAVATVSGLATRLTRPR